MRVRKDLVTLSVLMFWFATHIFVRACDVWTEPSLNNWIGCLGTAAPAYLTFMLWYDVRESYNKPKE